MFQVVGIIGEQSCKCCFNMQSLFWMDEKYAVKYISAYF